MRKIDNRKYGSKGLGDSVCIILILKEPIPGTSYWRPSKTIDDVIGYHNINGIFQQSYNGSQYP